MLLLLLLHTLTAGASPIPTSVDKDTSDSCNDINNCRKLSSIIWSCITTIILCTWVAIHPPVPTPANPSETGLWKKALRLIPFQKALITYSALFLPEILLMNAMLEWVKVQGLIKKNKDLPLTRTHGFFITMGGFYSTGDPDKPISDDNPQTRRLDSETVVSLLRAKVITLPSKEEIEDKGKSDLIAKVVAMVQLLWFILQCIARATEHLPITDLEIVTLGYTIIAVGIFSVWWNKPCDINYPIFVPQNRLDAHKLSSDNHQDKAAQEKGEGLQKFFGVQERVVLMLIILLGALFGAIHFIAWSSKFPSYRELVLWRASCIIMVVYPVMLYPWLMFFYGPHGRKLMANRGAIAGVTLAFTTLIASPYLLARATTVLLALITLKSLPLAAYIDVQWPSYIPHL